jgi:hypothetical protein
LSAVSRVGQAGPPAFREIAKPWLSCTVVAPVLIRPLFGRGHGIGGGAAVVGGGDGELREHVPPPPPDAAAFHAQRGSGQLGWDLNTLQGTTRYRSVVG